MAAPTVQQRAGSNRRTAADGGNAPQQAAVQAIPFCRAARRKSGQAYQDSYVLGASVVTARPIEVPASGFIRYLEFLFDLNVTGNSATVAAGGATLSFPWSLIASIQVTNAAGDSISVPLTGYELYLINKYGGTRESPQCDPYNDPQFEAVTTGAGATGGSLQFRLLFPFEIDPRDAFCSLPNMASNKSYQVIIQWNALATIFLGGTAPNGTATLSLTVDQHYWGQPQPQNAEGMPQATEPQGNGSVSLFRRQADTVSAGGRVIQLYNVGNVIRWSAFILQSSAANNPRTDADFPAISYLRLNNDQLFLKRLGNWEAEMRERYGFGTTAVTKDAAGFLDTGVYVLSDYMVQHGFVTEDGPRDQYLVTVDATLYQFEAAVFGATASLFTVLQNEIKPKDAQSLYSLNVV
jgi:hypothetical protein